MGSVDAVATLLRQEGKLLIPEDSFSIQFKSRTEKKIEYLDHRFQHLLKQELSLFIGKVNLRGAKIDLYNVGIHLAHPNIKDIEGLIIYFDQVPWRIENNVMHISLGAPILQWSSNELEKPSTILMIYEVLTKWLEIDRLNRQLRPIGMAQQPHWATNQVPTLGCTSLTWNHKNSTSSLSSIIPSVQLLGYVSLFQKDLRAPIIEIISWLKKHDLDPDPTGSIQNGVSFQEMKDLMEHILSKNDDAQICLALLLSRPSESEYVVIEMLGSSNGTWSRKIHRRPSVKDFQTLGFIVAKQIEVGQWIPILPNQDWLDSKSCEIIAEDRGVIMLQKKGA